MQIYLIFLLGAATAKFLQIRLLTKVRYAYHNEAVDNGKKIPDMPRHSDDTLLQKAITAAVLDRESFADCYSGKGPEAKEALRAVVDMTALHGKKLAKLSNVEQGAAYDVFQYAEQWEQSLAESYQQGKERDAAIRLAECYREVRIRRWGKTALEVKIESATVVKILPGGYLVPDELK